MADADQVDDEDQRLVGTDDRRRALLAVALVRRDDDLAAAPDAHALDAAVKAGDHLLGSQPEAEGLAAVVAGVELPVVRPRDADVLDFHGVALGRHRTAAEDRVLGSTTCLTA